VDRSAPAPVSASRDSPERSGIYRRPTVRIVKRRVLPRAALLSLGLAAAAAGVAFAAWRWWRPAPTGPVYRRSIEDVELTWKCEAGHPFTFPGRLTELPCTRCGQPAFPVTAYDCPEHGSFEVAVRFAIDASGNARVSHVRFQGGEWAPVADGPRCPKCGEQLVRKLTDPLPRTKKKSSG
jgi:hypothetical protein